ncbi:DJ-1/PfpI family protein [Thalassospira marina]|uniref:Thiamine biosynthesis protein ThiJ n=1 Tax=Thalassospira marina TaxID=2048283 RepID=A0A2N3KBY7_9PROT|nr:DJ-1/PfpI family protein [Thalassospira marina]PKR48055.1 thiamine biosynthesis protein ThiJ [Thalassospira marina]
MENPVNRRTFMTLAAATGVAATLPATFPITASAQTPTPSPAATPDQHPGPMRQLPADAPTVAILVHPHMLALDLIGPMTVLNILRCKIHLVWKDLTPVPTELGISIPPTTTFADCPRDLDVLLVPGGTMGTIKYMNDPEVLEFLTDRGNRAKWLSAFCTGSITLAATGLFNGYKATGYWSLTRFLPLMGATHIDDRVVVDRNRITAAGATAGIDCALVIATKLKGEEAARRVALTLEYSPKPPFKNGTPAEAGPERTQTALDRRKGMDHQVEEQVLIAQKRLGL